MKCVALFKKYSAGKHWESHPTAYAESFAQFLKDKKFDGLVVDVGCGNGRDVDVFSKLGFNALGIDNSEEELALAKKSFPNLNFELQNAENLKVKDNSVGACYMINVIHYLDKEKAINEVFRALKPKGYFFIHFNISIIDKNGKEDYSHNPEDILKLVSKFKILHKKVLKRTDHKPSEHTHEIMELILQKP